jgi:hypothetical protein
MQNGLVPIKESSEIVSKEKNVFASDLSFNIYVGWKINKHFDFFPSRRQYTSGLPDGIFSNQKS